ncbi:hypothetical protein [Chitinimonas taiwanensis]|uniref:hypothetical protein n=1 Tax=Chitinimonas taiwanensis TaxID=240412 RepID=UPI000AA4705F|nr:hypothetical protein [Chitinimonas taiwanensis]
MPWFSQAMADYRTAMRAGHARRSARPLWISAELPNGAGKPKQLVYNADVTGK